MRIRFTVLQGVVAGVPLGATGDGQPDLGTSFAWHEKGRLNRVPKRYLTIRVAAIRVACAC